MYTVFSLLWKRAMATAEVEHGRRRGTPKSMPSGDLSAERPRKGQTLVLPHTEWLRITASLSTADKKAEEAKARAEARKAMHEASKVMVKSWDNTIEGQRQKRLEARKIREEKEEADKVKIDIEEAKFQANQRKEAIEKARTMVYYQTDRVKAFHGALVLAEVLREREAQLKIKEAKDERAKHLNDKYLQLQEKIREQAEQADIEAAQIRTKAQDEAARFQLLQISEREKAHKKERDDLLAEQARLEQQAAEHAQKLKQLEEKRHQGKLAFRGQLEKHLEEKKALEEVSRRQKEVEEEEGRLYAEGKKKMTQMRKQKEAELLHELQHTQEKMAAMLEKEMSKKSSDEDQRIAKMVEEQDAKKAQEEKLKEERYQEQCREISKHRAKVMAETERKRQEQLEYDRELLKQRVIQDHKFHAQNQDKQKKRAEEARAVQQHHKLQMGEWAAKAEREKAEELALMDAHREVLEVEEKQFQEYANMVIKEAEARGAPTEVLKKAASLGAEGGHGRTLNGTYVQPSFKAMDVTGVELPSYQPPRPLSPSIRRRPVDTHKRMGFSQ